MYTLSLEKNERELLLTAYSNKKSPDILWIKRSARKIDGECFFLEMGYFWHVSDISQNLGVFYIIRQLFNSSSLS